jgi:putative peptide zinc metalloprotease protein
MWRSPARPALAIDTVGRLTGRPPASRRSTTGRQRLAVSCYGIVLVLGSAVCLGFFVLVSLPFTVGLLTGAAAELRSSDPVQIADAAATVTYLALLAALWCRAWWRRHGNKLSRKHREGNDLQLEVP